MSGRLGTLLPMSALYARSSTDYHIMGELFVDWLSRTGQQIWQLLPLNPTGYDTTRSWFSSPYWSYGIGIDPLYLRHLTHKPVKQSEVETFIESEKSWIYGYAVFQCLSEKHATDDWRRWDSRLHRPDSALIEHLSANFKTRVEEIVVEQYHLHIWMRELRHYAHTKGVQLWGDLPFFVPLESYYGWRYPRAFCLTDDTEMEYIAGSIAGRHWHERQIWGFPLYDFDRPETGLIWQERMSHSARLFDRVRLDSASRLYEYEAFHVGDSHRDEIRRGPGDTYLRELVQMTRSLGSDLYIEDISYLNMDRLHAQAQVLDVAGVSVLTMLFAKQTTNIHHEDFDAGAFGKNHIFFTATHDSPSLAAYLRSLTPAQQAVIRQLCNITGTDSPTAPLLIAYLTRHAQTLIVLFQDWIGSDKRINIPGTINEENWNYRMDISVENLPLTFQT